MALRYGVEVHLSTSGSLQGLPQTVDQAKAAAGALDGTAAAGKRAAGGLNEADAAARRNATGVRGLVQEYTSLRGILATIGVAVVAQSFFEANRAAAAYAGGLQTATESQAAAAREMQFLRQTVGDLGLNLSAIAPQFVSITAAASGTSLAGRQTQQIFAGIVEYGTALRVGNERLTLSLQAVQQMMSKGKVSSEELRQQLGESLPGAMRIAAEAMGVGTAEFQQMLDTGQVMAEDLLPKMAARMRDLAAAGLEAAKNSPEAEINRLRNALTDVFTAVGEAGLNDALAEFFRQTTAALKEFVSSGAAAAVGQLLAIIVRHLDELLLVVTAVLGARGIVALVAGFRGVTASLAGMAAAVQIANSDWRALATGASTAASTVGSVGAAARVAGSGLLALVGGPIGAAVAGLAALTYGVFAYLEATQSTAPQARAAIESATAAVRDMQQATADLGKSIDLDQYRQKADGLKPVLADLLQRIDETNQRIADGESVRWRTAEYFRAMREERSLLDDLVKQLVDVQMQMRSAAAAIDTATDALARQQASAAAFQEVTEDLERQAVALQAQNIALTEGQGAALAWQAAQKLGKNASDEQREAVQKLISQIVGLTGANAELTERKQAAARAASELTREIERERLELNKLREQMPLDEQKRLNDLLRAETEERAKRDRAIAESQTQLDDYIRGIENETRLLQLSGEARADAARLMEAERIQRAVLRDLIAGNISQTEAEARALEARNRALAALTERDAVTAARELADAWEQSAGRISDALEDGVGAAIYQVLDNVHSIGDAFDELADDIADTAKRAVAQWLAEMAKLRFINPLLNSVLGSALPTAGAGAGGLGQLLNGGFGGLGSILSGGSILGSLFSGSGAPGGGIGANFVGPLQPGQAAPGAAIGTFGNLLGVAGGAFGVYSAFRSGNPLSGAISGAAGGASLASLFATTGAAAGPVGAIIGAIVGGLAGLLGGPKPPDLRLGGVGVTRKPEVTFETALGTSQVGVRGGVDEREFIALVTQFDAQLARVIGTFRDGDTQLAAVRASLARWAIDLKGDAITAEAVLNGRFGAILSTFSADVQAFVGQAGTVEERVQRLADAAFVDAAAASGELLDSFGPLAALLERHRAENEALTDTYARLAAETATLEAATQIMGVDLGLTREKFIEFAAAIAEAAGGLKQAAQLWDNYFTAFYDGEERATMALAAATEARNSQLTALGLETTISAEQFREAFEAALPQLTPDQVVQWLRAGAAIAAATAAEEQLAEARGQTTTVTEFNIDALRRLSDLQQSHIDQLASLGRSEFGNDIAEIYAWRDAQVQALNESSQAAFGRAASEEDLGRVYAITTIRVRRALEQLEAGARDRVGRLRELTGGNSTAGAATEVQQADIAGTSAVRSAVEDRYARELQLLGQLSEWLDQLTFSALSNATPAEQLAAAQTQFRETLLAAQGGDLDAMQQLQGVAQQYLQAAQSFYGVAEAYDQIFADVTSSIRGLINRGPLSLPTAGQPGGGGELGQTVISATEGVTTAVQSSTDALASERLALVEEIAGIIREVIGVTRESLVDVTQRIGTSVQELVTAAGINTSEMTVATTVQLATLAQQLGVDLREVTDALGLDLGSLADRQSLLNQALGSTINRLPVEQRDRLRPLFDAIATATTEADANAAIGALEAEVNLLPAGLRDLLAPFFSAVSPAETNQVTILSELRIESRNQTNVQRQMLAALLNPPASGLTPIPVIPVGTGASPTPINGAPGKSLQTSGAPATDPALLEALAAGRRREEALREELAQNRAVLRAVQDALKALGIAITGNAKVQRDLEIAVRAM